MGIFKSGNLLLPKNVELDKWAVIACDQFTSEPEYWQQVEQQVGSCPSALHITLPEVYLQGDCTGRIAKINATMGQYLQQGIFQEYKNAYVYVERTLLNGDIRQGLVGVVDLEAYDFNALTTAPVRATERTVLERIPPRKKIREHAAVELSHVLLLCDDKEDRIFRRVAGMKPLLPELYNFDLMCGGGHIRGWLVQGEQAAEVDRALDEYATRQRSRWGEGALLFAVGDGNHSLCTAKACYRERPSPVARYAMVELENIHHNSQKFAPIHRLLQGVDVPKLLSHMEKFSADDGHPVRWQAGERTGVLHLDKTRSVLPLGILQEALDGYLKDNPGTLDYIHGEESLSKLAAAPDSIGFFLSAIGKDDFFRSIMKDGVFPRKTFSMGQAREKRYYLEARKIE